MADAEPLTSNFMKLTAMNEEGGDIRYHDLADSEGSPKTDFGSNPTSSSSSSPQVNTANAATPAQRSGRWAPDEKILFLYGLKRFGKGRWKKMSVYLPHRSLVQIKSHAQKVLKRLEAGENVFRRLDENYGVIDSLIVQAAKQRDAMVGAVSANSPSQSISSAAKRKRAKKHSLLSREGTPSPAAVGEYHNQTFDLHEADVGQSSKSESETGRGAVIAAAALCQLSSRGSWDKAAHGAMQKTF